MFKFILKGYLIFRYEYVQIWAPIVVFIITIIWGFWGLFFETDISFWKNWENVCVFSTLAYTILLYLSGMFGDKFKGVIDLNKGVDFGVYLKAYLKKVGAIGLLIVIIGILAISIGKEKMLFIDMPLGRIIIMLLYFLISLFYFGLNIVLIKIDVPEKDEIVNSIKYCDGPTCITFFVLFIYACCLGSQKINELTINSFFSGAIVFQMILSNIIWGMMDNSARIKKCKIIKKLTGG